MEPKDILNALRDIEEQDDINILFACESGSRAWGFDSPDSDYDVRFVYMRTLADYLSLKDVSDTKEYRLSDDLDIVGWDLRKFLRLLRKSNPSTMEWMGSPVVYSMDTRFQRVRDLRECCFDPASCAWHYYGMAKKHDTRYLDGEMVSAKKYLYIVRAILSAEWCIREQSPAPILFSELLGTVTDENLRKTIELLVKTKQSSAELALVSHDEALDEWIFDELDRLKAEIGKIDHIRPLAWLDLDSVFLGVLGFL